MEDHLIVKAEDVKTDNITWVKTDILLCSLLWHITESQLHSIYKTYKTYVEI